MTTTNQQAAEFLRRVRARIEKLEDWITGNLMAAIRESVFFMSAMDRTCLMLRSKAGSTIDDFEKIHTHAEVLALVDSAIKELEGSQ